MSPRNTRIKDSEDSRIGTEAARWLLRLQETSGDSREHDAAFLNWLGISAQHVRLFLETFQTYRLLGNMDAQRAIDIQELLENHRTDVIHFHGAQLPTRIGSQPPGRFLREGLRFAAAAAIALAIGAVITWGALDSGTYSTAIGEQRTCKLDDGSFVYLNTDSRLQVRFSKDARHIRLVRGEALFAVERDSRRPFIVNTGDADIQAVGTQFNVRRRTGLTDVAVVEGAVQVTVAPSTASAGSTAPTRLGAGEEARVGGGNVTKAAHPDVENALAWRERRLVFTDAPLLDVAAEFNRYNKTRIHVEGSGAQRKQFTGIFDADRPQALIMYAMKDESLAVEPDGAGWIIRGR